jgi:hypothetical protein
MISPYIAFGISRISSPSSYYLEFYLNNDGNDNTQVDVYFWLGTNTVFNMLSVYYLAVEESWRSIFVWEWIDMASQSSRTLLNLHSC